MNAEITWRIDPGLRSAKNPTRVYGQQRADVVKTGVAGEWQTRRRGGVGWRVELCAVRTSFFHDSISCHHTARGEAQVRVTTMLRAQADRRFDMQLRASHHMYSGSKSCDRKLIARESFV